MRGKLQQHRLAYYAHAHRHTLARIRRGKKNKGEQTGCHSSFILAVTPVRSRDHRPWQISMVLDLQVLDLALCIVGLPSKDSFLLNDSSSMSSRKKQQPFFFPALSTLPSDEGSTAWPPQSAIATKCTVPLTLPSLGLELDVQFMHISR